MRLKLNKTSMSDCGYITKRALTEGLEYAICGYVQGLQVSEEGNRCVVVALVRHFMTSNSWYQTRITTENSRMASWSCACIKGYVQHLLSAFFTATLRPFHSHFLFCVYRRIAPCKHTVATIEAAMFVSRHRQRPPEHTKFDKKMKKRQKPSVYRSLLPPFTWAELIEGITLDPRTQLAKGNVGAGKDGSPFKVLESTKVHTDEEVQRRRLGDAEVDRRQSEAAAAAARLVAEREAKAVERREVQKAAVERKKKKEAERQAKKERGDSVFCKVCDKERVAETKGGQTWAQCEACREWFHRSCDPTMPNEVSAETPYTCCLCFGRAPRKRKRREGGGGGNEQ